MADKKVQDYEKTIVVLLTVAVPACTCIGCGNAAAPEGADASGASSEDSSVVTLMDLYSVEDPGDVTYDQRTVLYMPVLESDEHYADGARHLFSVLYGKEGKGVYMYNVEIFEEAERATSYQEQAGAGKTDGVAFITDSDENFFIEMESFIPDLQTMIDNLMESGMMEPD